MLTCVKFACAFVAIAVAVIVSVGVADSTAALLK
jgi:hypothetical protein